MQVKIQPTFLASSAYIDALKRHLPRSITFLVTSKYFYCYVSHVRTSTFTLYAKVIHNCGSTFSLRGACSGKHCSPQSFKHCCSKCSSQWNDSTEQFKWLAFNTCALFDMKYNGVLGNFQGTFFFFKSKLSG